MNRRLALVTLAAIILVAGCSRRRTEDVRVAPAAESSGGTVLWDEGYPYWWKLSEVVSFDKPIPCRGNVGMWQMPSALAAQVTAADSLGVGAKAIIVAHNHPSGDATPSVQDHELTVSLKHLGETLGVPVLDHLILGGESFTSI